MEKKFSCHDGSIAPVLGKQNRNGKWVLYNISQVIGMGSAEYDNQMTAREYDELVTMNSFSGVSYIAALTDNKWTLIEIRDNNTAACEWRVMNNENYNSLDELLAAYNINREDYRSY